VIHKALERLLKADCLNMTEAEIDDALKYLREKYGVEGFSLDSSTSASKFRLEDITLD
jgi:Xaa-Pro aminopeptidase